MAGLCVALMVISRFISITDYAISALCGLIIGFVVIECNKRWAMLTYIVTSLLSLWFGSSEATVVFVVFLGYYPIIKPWIDHLPKVFSVISKLGLFNLVIVLTYFVLDYLKFIPLEQIGVLGQYTNIVLLILANVVFLIYDYAFNGVMSMYYARLHPRVSSIIK